MNRYRVETPHGVITRTSNRKYTHVVTRTMTLIDGRVCQLDYVFAGRKDLAIKAADNMRKHSKGRTEQDPANSAKLRFVPAQSVEVLITEITQQN